MLKTKWLNEEKYVLQEAYRAGVSLKIIALGLGRSESAVSKQLARSGYRAKKETSGPSKGAQRRGDALEEQRQKIEGLIHHAFSEKGLQRLNLQQGARVQKDREMNISYSYKIAHDALGESWNYPQERRRSTKGKRLGEDDKHSFKSLIFVESWARHQGFEFKRLNQATGFPLYIMKGKPHSHAQFCMRVNARRLEQKLPALVVEEWQERV